MLPSRAYILARVPPRCCLTTDDTEIICNNHEPFQELRLASRGQRLVQTLVHDAASIYQYLRPASDHLYPASNDRPWSIVSNYQWTPRKLLHSEPMSKYIGTHVAISSPWCPSAAVSVKSRQHQCEAASWNRGPMHKPCATFHYCWASLWLRISFVS